MGEVLDAPHAWGLRAGTRLGRYECRQRLAVGGMAELYLGRAVGVSGFEKLVAIKRILPHLAEDPHFVKMFMNEARLAAALDHANIVHVMDFGVEAGEHFLAMEYVHGRTLRDVLEEATADGPIPLAPALSIVVAAAAGLHYVHERRSPQGRALGLVHRDVSASNVIVGFNGDVKIVDFGIAKATQTTRATRTEGLKGKIAYMAPEQARGKDVDRRADVFALGVLLYELTTGRRMFYAPNEFALINKVARGEFDPPSTWVAEYPHRLAEIVARAAERDADSRYATAVELQTDLEEFALSAGLRLSSSVVAEFMLDAFGEVPYPTVVPVTEHPPPGATVLSPPPRAAATRSTTGRAPRRRWALLATVAATLGIGVVLGRAFAGPVDADGGAAREDRPDDARVDRSPPTANPGADAQPASGISASAPVPDSDVLPVGRVPADASADAAKGAVERTGERARGRRKSKKAKRGGTKRSSPRDEGERTLLVPPSQRKDGAR